MERLSDLRRVGQKESMMVFERAYLKVSLSVRIWGKMMDSQMESTMAFV
jgi:hypothetical protein